MIAITDVSRFGAIAQLVVLIQDLSDNAVQPMKSKDNRFVIVFNGEIYNHLDLRNKIKKENSYKNWKGTSDTETLLVCIEYFGIEKL